VERELTVRGPLDLARTLGLLRIGRGDPTLHLGPGRARHAFWTPGGPGTLGLDVLRRTDDEVRVRVRGWGAGGAWLLEQAPRYLGVDDRPDAFDPRATTTGSGGRRLARLQKKLPGIRAGTTPVLMQALVPTILQQRVTWREAVGAWRDLARRFGEPAPGPAEEVAGLRLPTPAERLAKLPYYELHAAGVERTRAETVKRAAKHGAKLELLRDVPVDEAKSALLAIRGIGRWTVEMVAGVGLSDPDAVPTGDFHLPNTVAWALAREDRADDERMLELLEPFRGHRFRVIRLLAAAGIHAPRYGPRLAPRKWTRR